MTMQRQAAASRRGAGGRMVEGCGLVGAEFGYDDASTCLSALGCSRGGVPASGRSGRVSSGFIVYRIIYMEYE